MEGGFFMGLQAKETKPIKHICAGLLAHVDAGKTTLSEGILYLTGEIRRQGRVDHGDAFLDTYELEKKRGITIFSKQAEFKLGEKSITLLDTPGHVDFSAEMERTLGVLDYAILLISGPEGVDDHSRALFELLKRYSLPTFIFVNKMDMEVCDRRAIMAELRSRLSSVCVDFEDEEDMASCDEEILEDYLERGELSEKDKIRLSKLIKRRRIFPVYFGSALKLTGVEEFLEGIREYTEAPEYGKEFCGRVFKIGRDEQGKRLTYIKLMGGSLRPKEQLTGGDFSPWQEKADELRLYSGKKYKLLDEAESGMAVAVTGLNLTRSGETVFKAGEHIPDAVKAVIRNNDRRTGEQLTEPVLEYRIIFPEGTDELKMWENLKSLSEELPEIRLRRDEKLKETRIGVMGDVQTEILKNLVEERFGISFELGEGEILYRETIRNRVEGIGHYEPLRHYAEVHLILEPLPLGSGIEVISACPTDVLSQNRQSAVLARLSEYKHVGVLTGSELTDVRIILASGKDHEKHTEGGDFTQAALRAVRQGLMQAESVLLEPWYDFSLELPRELVGRAMNDLSRMSGSFSEPEEAGENRIAIRGSAPVSELRFYQKELLTYSGGRGRLNLEPGGYRPAHDQDEVVERIGYSPDSDLENPTGSVFCVHGGGFYVPWNEVPEYMHLESVLKAESDPRPGNDLSGLRSGSKGGAASSTQGKSYSAFSEEDKELTEIFLRTYGESKRSRDMFKSVKGDPEPKGKERSLSPKAPEKREEFLLVDGYNVIFAWDELRELAEINIDSARARLMERLSNYQGYRKMNLILVFDAYKVAGNHGNVEKYHNIYVVYTKEAETADQYIAKTVSTISDKYNVTVATSDSLVQLIIFSKSAIRMSARELLEEVELAEREIRERYLSRQKDIKTRVGDLLE
ncbi:MAG: NYN domain-containing protein [Candidatus Avilachnospira sp.]|jgi:ribosomal protection tetracycline resistance protein